MFSYNRKFANCLKMSNIKKRNKKTMPRAFLNALFSAVSAVSMFLYVYSFKRMNYLQSSLNNIDAAEILKQKIEKKCRINSEKWLFGPRLGNVHNELDENEHLVKHMLLGTDKILLENPFDENGQLSFLLSQTMCLPNSQFRNVTLLSSVSSNIKEPKGSSNNALIRQWAVKLIYLSLHYHQHKHALPEAEHRYGTGSAPNDCLPVTQAELTNKYSVGRFDYECPNAKFLVTFLHQVGLGANIRTGVVPAMMLGLMTDRVVLIINNVPKSVEVPNRILHDDWPLVSCPRQDYQCFFWPTSPCVLTEDDITNAYALNESESRGLRDNIIPKYADHHKVWIWHNELLPMDGYHSLSAEKLHDFALQMVSRVPDSIDSQYKELLSKAVEQIRVNDGIRDGFNHLNSRSKVQHTFTIFALRPLPHVSKRLDSNLADIIPANFNPANSIGLPVRASDKCDRESECLTFGQHMIVAGEMWQKHLNYSSYLKDSEFQQQQLSPTVIFTTEATSMVEEQKAFVKEKHVLSHYSDLTFNFINNHHDVTPNSGFMKDSRRRDSDSITADAIMMSVLSTIKAQLMPQITVANCCSGFHQMFNDFLFESCGAVAANTYHCLQDTEDPLLVPCCGGHTHCFEKKRQKQLEINADERELPFAEKKEKCRINSEKWLLGPRLGNVHNELDENEHLVKHMLLGTDKILLENPFDENGQLSFLLSQTMCLPNSQFRNVTLLSSVSSNIKEPKGSSNNALIRQWAVKLIYLSLHYHQHKHALPEAEHRYGTGSAPNDCLPVTQAELTNKYSVGRFDYECPNAKFLVTFLHQVGLGANIRTGVVPAMMLGLMTDRVVLIINNVPKSVEVPNRILHDDWPLVSCPRQDYQCFFWPTSPCVLTEDDITNAYALNESESRGLRDNIIPKYADHHKVWIWHNELLPMDGYHSLSAEKLHDFALQMVSRVPDSIDSQYKELLSKAVEQIRVNDGIRDGFNHLNSRSKVQHTFTIFALRPLPHVSKRLDSNLADIIPANFNPANSIGLPVRASDKCDRESECLTFGQHMIVAGEMWQKHLNYSSYLKDSEFQQQQLSPTVIFTTEATSMVEEQKAFVKEKHVLSHYSDLTFNFINNHHDVTPNSGFMKDSRRRDSDSITADAIMMSVLSTIKAQLMPQITVANCCSGFHQMFNDFLFESCGAVAANTYHCLQDTEDPLLVPCCGGHTHCFEKKRQEQLKNNRTLHE